MPSRKHPSYIDVDSLLPQVTPQQAAAYYGFPLPESSSDRELRLACPFNCSDRTDNPRAIAVSLTQAANPLTCHQYQCGVRGNLLTLMFAMKHGRLPTGGRLKGSDFKEMATDLQSIANGESSPVPPSPARPPQQSSPAYAPAEPGADVARDLQPNVPLRLSDNERAQAQEHLDDQFVTDVAEMSPAAAAYFRSRPWFTPELMEKWKVGYLPQSVKGLFRGRIMYPMLSERGDVLSWFGRDPRFEEKYDKWIRAGKPEKDRPAKYRFVSQKLFRRGLELFGQQASRLEEPGYRDAVRELGVLVVEGPNDVTRLDELGVPSVAICSNMITEPQSDKVAKWANQIAGRLATVMLDCDEEGETGSRQVVHELAKRCRVRLAWHCGTGGGRFRGKQPESLSFEEWTVIRESLAADR